MNILNKNAVENKIFTKCGLKAKMRAESEKDVNIQVAGELAH